MSIEIPSRADFDRLHQEMRDVSEKLDALLGQREKQHYTTAEAAKYIGCTEYTVRGYVKEGKLEATRPGGHRLAFTKEALDGFLDR